MGLRFFETNYHCGPPIVRWQSIAPTTAIRIISRGRSLSFPYNYCKNADTKTKAPPTICYAEELPHTTNTSNVAICYKPKYNLHLSYGVNAAFMCTVTCFLDTRAGINLVNRRFLPHIRPTASNAKRCPIVALQCKNHSA